MNVLVTGAKGFIGRNLIAALRARKDGPAVYEYDTDTPVDKLDAYCADCSFVFHLAGINRPKETFEFMEGNFGFTSVLLDKLRKHANRCPVLLTSSTQATLSNPYGESKKAGEEALFAYGQEVSTPVYVYRLPNVFGKWCRPNYNSAIATFCYNIARDLPITVNDPAAALTLVYIDDVVNELLNALKNRPMRDGAYCRVAVTHSLTLGEIVERIRFFRESRESLGIPDLADSFTKKLYSTYLSYLPTEQFSYSLRMNVDARGSFTEILRTVDRGQFSVNISKPGITKGNHWHNSKVEKFCVVSGRGIIRFRQIDSDEIVEYHVSGETIDVVDIPPGYTHNIENVGNADLVTFMWCNEGFDPSNPDTYFLEVAHGKKA